MALPADIDARPASEFSNAELAAGFTHCFEGYVVPVSMTEDALGAMILRDDVDLTSSRVFVSEGRVAAIALVSRRGEIARISAFGVAPEHRRRGLGRAAMEVAISACRRHEDRTLVLEVIEQNPPALALYGSLGFQKTRRLVGYVLDDTGRDRNSRETNGLEEIPPETFARKCHEEGDGNLSWQLSPSVYDRTNPVDRALRLSGAYCLVGDTSAETVALKGIVVDRASRRRGEGSAVISSLREKFPGRRWNVSSIVPEELAPGFFESNGFVENKISQQEMRLDLS